MSAGFGGAITDVHELTISAGGTAEITVTGDPSGVILVFHDDHDSDLHLVQESTDTAGHPIPATGSTDTEPFAIGPIDPSEGPMFVYSEGGDSVTVSVQEVL